jgi:hypothetical protein
MLTYVAACAALTQYVGKFASVLKPEVDALPAAVRMRGVPNQCDTMCDHAFHFDQTKRKAAGGLINSSAPHAAPVARTRAHSCAGAIDIRFSPNCDR